MSLNGHTPDNLDPGQNPRNSEPRPEPVEGAPATSPTPEGAPVQLAFGFDLTPQPEGRKVPFLKRVQENGLSCYWEIYQQLLDNPPEWETKFWADHPNRKREWAKKALYIAWACAPASARQPRKQNEFAEAIGVTPQTICNWKTKNPEMNELISELALYPLEAAVRDVDYVTLVQATALDSPVPARKLFYERLEQARATRHPIPPQQVNQLLQIFLSNINWDALPQEAVERIAAGENPLAVLVSGVAEAR